MTESIIVLGSGSKTGGGSGFKKLVEYFSGKESARVVGVVCNIRGGGVEEKADGLGVPFMHLPNTDCTAEGYGSIASHFGVSDPWYACSGWLRHIKGLPRERSFNIHPALLSQLGGRFGGPGKYGHFVHEDVKAALDEGLVNCSGFTMHFIDDEYDRGRMFAEVRVPLTRGMSADDIGSAVNAAEHRLQPWLTELVIRRQIRLEGDSLVTPAGYEYLQIAA